MGRGVRVTGAVRVNDLGKVDIRNGELGYGCWDDGMPRHL